MQFVDDLKYDGNDNNNSHGAMGDDSKDVSHGATGDDWQWQTHNG